MYSHTLPTHSRTEDGRESVLAVQPHTQNSCTGVGGRLAFAVQPHVNAAQSRAQGEDRERKGEGGEEGKQEHLIKRKGERGGAGCC